MLKTRKSPHPSETGRLPDISSDQILRRNPQASSQFGDRAAQFRRDRAGGQPEGRADLLIGLVLPEAHLEDFPVTLRQLRKSILQPAPYGRLPILVRDLSVSNFG